MHIIKLNATDSTNSYLRNKCIKETVEDFTVIVADQQKKGRGQVGTKWTSEAGKNLIFSVFKNLKSLNIEHPFYLSLITSLAIENALKKANIQHLKIKWPNDILSDNQKICGILIENVFKRNSLKSSIIGIGLNVNQTQFNDLPNASSLKLKTGINYDLNELLITILNELKTYFKLYENGELFAIKQEYESKLFRNNKPSTFRKTDGTLFSGYIKGISTSGKLNILIEDNINKEFDLKEVELLY